MKVGAKRRRTKLEIEEQKLHEQEERAAVLAKLDQIEKMQEQMTELKMKAQWAE